MSAKKKGVGEHAKAAILSGLSNEAALAKVRKACPDSEVSLASINWYRNKLRSERGGRRVKTARELKAKAKK